MTGQILAEWPIDIGACIPLPALGGIDRESILNMTRFGLDFSLIFIPSCPDQPFSRH